MSDMSEASNLSLGGATRRLSSVAPCPVVALPARSAVLAASHGALCPRARRGASSPLGNKDAAVARFLEDALGPEDTWMTTMGAVPTTVRGPRRQHPLVMTQRLSRPAFRRLFADARWHLLRLSTDVCPPCTRTIRMLSMWEGAYRPVSGALAALMAEAWEARPGPVLFEDYDLSGSALALRDLLPDAPMGLFCHSRFPSPNALRTLPHLVTLDFLHGLLACDLVTFRTHRDLALFQQLTTELLGIRPNGGMFIWRRRRVRLEVLPPTVDLGEIRTDFDPFEPERAPFPEDALVITWFASPDRRSDPVGAIAGFARLLSLEPALHGRARLVLHLSPPQESDEGGRDCINTVVHAATALNALAASETWVPVAVDVSGRRGARRPSIERADVVVVRSSTETIDRIVAETAALARRAPAMITHATAEFLERFPGAAIAPDGAGAESEARTLLTALRMSRGEREHRFSTLCEAIAARPVTHELTAQVGAVTAVCEPAIPPDSVAAGGPV